MDMDRPETTFPEESPVNHCPAVGYQRVAVCTAVTVTPCVRLGSVTAVRCGDPVVCARTCDCPGEENGSCCFTIRQQLCVEVPVFYGANVELSDPNIVCISASGEDCTDCNGPWEGEEAGATFQGTQGTQETQGTQGT
ncbi:MAG: hypothetical protein VB111_07215 [Clostridiaceae bacterium]|nr:hypothetical protein [Clostridiaceae bacterium]